MFKKELIIIQQIQETEQAFQEFRANVDAWIKDFNVRVNDVETFSESFEEMQGNTNHNYELILDSREKIDDLKQQIQTMKLTQLLIIKKVFAEELSLDGKNKHFLKKLLEQEEKKVE